MNRLHPIIFLLICVACSDSKETRLQRFLIQGNEKIEQQDLDQAEYFFQEAIEMDPCFADALNNLGTLYFKRGNFQQSIEYYTRAVECRPGYIDAHLNRANAFLESKEYYRALDDLSIVAKTKPDTAVVPFMKGLALTQLAKHDEAIRAFRHAERLHPNDAETLVNLGNVYFFKKNFDSATVYLASALKLDDRQLNAYNTMALILTEEERYPEALAMVNKAIALNPTDPYALNNRGYIHLLTGQYDQAKEYFDASISVDPYNGWAYRNKGIYFLKNEKYDDALRMLQKAEKLDPNIDQLYINLSEAYLQTKDFANACKAYEKAMAKGEKGNTSMKPCK